MKSAFQVILLGIFIVFIVVGVVFFALSGKDSNTANSKVVVWGTLDSTIIDQLVDGVNQINYGSINITYVEKDASTFDKELVEAIASGEGPDIFFLEEDKIVANKNKIIPIPYDVFSARQYKDLFIEEGELFLMPEGIIAFPFVVDPLVTYWNRTIFSTAGISQVPQYWDEFSQAVSKITQKDSSFNVTRSAVALGEWRNVNNAREIFSTLLLQAGNPITQIDEDFLEVTLSDKFNYVTPPAESALRFYTEFANPTKSLYSWNRALDNSQNAFVSGDLAMYFGFASELPEIRKRNPNLNFDVAEFPQSRDSNKRINYGKMIGLAIVKSSPNTQSALSALNALTSGDAQKTLSGLIGLPPVRRDILVTKPSDAFMETFYNSAIRATAWLDPDQEKTNEIFQTMVEDVLSGRLGIDEAVRRGDLSLEDINR